ncbi:carboxypeptidase-like regulatory domain-containing protein [Flagellimonas halotolerans]|uniref:Carboxypeptidase-like regulatory domain-containing protein n=1 Tax=Flagellimonas halotolerans TaxID=3112164 RepID=A0ABU6INE4_9FLAO|nr:MULTISPECIES: carboxypeptidase-like regulatory domain-containing protein [unclassified Allomuricauda]MEC3964724.1 carboxypeptidase-like regulatory domain-containing protein [Muricauda sp. SYSU M86414]MEC4264593.1 carboxypeptidase-like regulatory domain-containing protein [Muricauda sp. SYSU M84420]
MKTLFSILFLFGVVTLSFAQKNIVGHVNDGNKPLSNVKIINLSSEESTTSNTEGRYEILAAPREELQYTHMGMDTITIIVEDVTRILNIAMQPRVELLDEVVVTKKISRQKNLAMNYFMDSTIVHSSFGYISPATVAYHLKVIDGSEFTQGSDVLRAIASRRSGIRIGTNSNPSTGRSVRTLFLRGGGSINNQKPALFEVDGSIFTDPPIWLDVSNIQRVGIIPGIQAVWRYGHIASGGVVIINTNNGVHGLREENSLKIYDQARLRNNFVTGKVVSSSEAKDDLPLYLKEMANAVGLNKMIQTYHNYEKDFSGVPYFYLDAYSLFFKKHGKGEADKIIVENFNFFEENPVWLKALAFTYESQSRFDKAYEVYKKIYLLRPDYTQSFINMANNYHNLGKTEQAALLYARHAYLQGEGLISSGDKELSAIIAREIENLFGAKMNKNNSPLGDYTTRLVFEWNDSEAEFDLQFVNPSNQYFNWKHTLAEMPERIRSEKKLGYSMADFLLDDELPGIWRINATYHGNKQLTPSYLKVTIYRNYGSKLQSKEIKVYRLGTKGANRHLFDFTLPSPMAQSK